MASCSAATGRPRTLRTVSARPTVVWPDSMTELL
jgi:hypothetical protein